MLALTPTLRYNNRMLLTPVLTRRALSGLAILMFVLSLARCVNDPLQNEIAPRWESGPQGTWFAGDFHVHTSVGSNDTRYPDGRRESYPDTIVKQASETGLSFVVITDHSNSAGSDTDTTTEYGSLWNQGPEFPLWDTAAALTGASFILVDGSELSPVSTLEPKNCVDCSTPGSGALTPVGHVGCFAADLASFIRTGAIVDRPPGAVEGGSGVAQCHERGGFAVINHPYPTATPWMQYDWTSFDYDAIEVYNGSIGYDVFDKAAYDAYLCDRLAGRAVVALGGSDNHRTRVSYDENVGIKLGPPLGLPFTSILSDTLAWPALIENLRAGHVVIHEKGTFVEFRIFAAKGYIGGVGDSVSAASVSEEAVVWLRGESKVAQDLQLWHVAPGACADPRAPHVETVPTVVKKRLHSSGVDGVFTFQKKLRLTPGLYFATVGAADTTALFIRNVAVTNVFTVKP